MKIEITAKNLDLTPSITEYVGQKLGGLDKFVERLDLESGGELELKVTVERITAHHHKGEVFSASADLVLPRKNLHAEQAEEGLHAAIDAVKNELRTEIEKYKQK